MATQPIYTFYLKLKDVQPEVWRLVQVPKNRTVAQLGYIIMTLFEMQASHLFEFKQVIGPGSLEKWQLGSDLVFYGLPIPEDDDLNDQLDARTTKISTAFSSRCREAAFNYDFGDGWEIEVILADIDFNEALSGRELPRVFAGVGYGIVEDVGGPYGLMKFANAFKAKRGEEYRRYRDWWGTEDFDINLFNLDEMNKRLKKAPNIYRRVYEANQEPTETEINFLKRRE